jgi:MFS family permease
MDATGRQKTPLVLGRLFDTLGRKPMIAGTYLLSDTVVAFSVGAVLMIAAGVVEIFLGVRAERQGLEQIARPLSAAGAPASNDGSGQRRARAAG